MEKVKMVLNVPTALKDELDSVVALYVLKGKKLTKTEIVSEALEREIERKKLGLLELPSEVDRDCLFTMLKKIKEKVGSLSEEKLAELTARLAERAYRKMDEVGEERRELLKRIAESMGLKAEKWDEDTLLFLIELAIEECRKSELLRVLKEL